MFTPSPQQAVYYDWIVNGTGSCVVEAVAGSGKTTTCIEGLKLMHGRKFFGAYNKPIADEIALRTRALGIPELFVRTMHGAGFSALLNAFGRDLKVDENKCRNIYREASERNPAYKPLEGSVLKLVSYAKQRGIGALENNMGQSAAWFELINRFDVETFDEETSTDNTRLIMQLASKTLRASIDRDSIVVDYDDMVYSPLYHNLRIYQYDWVIIDEAQDTNATRRALALRMLKRNGRLVAVGDRHQAIYGFTGADSEALDLIVAAVNAKQLPLTTTYRCPKAVVAYAQQWVSHIQAADSAPDGMVSEALASDLTKLVSPGDAVLCRFNAPLVQYVYKFIAEGIAAKVEGRKIGDGLKQLARRYKIKSLTAMLTKLDAYAVRESAKFRAKEQESKAVAVEDMVTCLRVIIERVAKVEPDTKQPVDRVCAEIDMIFVDGFDSKCVILCSIHKSKGREWHKVAWLQTGPCAWARQDWEKEQEVNLNYVAATRAKHELVLVSMDE